MFSVWFGARHRKGEGSRLSALEDLVDPDERVSLEQARIGQRSRIGRLETKAFDEAQGRLSQLATSFISKAAHYYKQDDHP
jgi:hypothetical protein